MIRLMHKGLYFSIFILHFFLSHFVKTDSGMPFEVIIDFDHSCVALESLMYFALRGLLVISVQATDKDWVQLHGKFLLNSSPSRVVIFLEGPPPSADILLNNLVVKHAAKAPPAFPPVIQVAE